MAADPLLGWARAVRVLALLCAALLIIAIVEARALRRARAELQQLRRACPQATASLCGQSGCSQSSQKISIASP
jgi:hypothetical protein